MAVEATPGTAELRDVTVVIATTCERSRRDRLRRGIESVLMQKDASVRLLMVVNGTRFDADLYAELRRDSRLDVHYREQGSLPGAILAGRRLVNTSFFSFLDDDDVYLPGTLAARLDAFAANPGCDFVVTSGYKESYDRPVLTPERIEALANDALAYSIRGSWIASCGGCFKTATVGPEFFEDVPRYFEWTWIAFRLLACGKRFSLVQEPGYSISRTPGSLSSVAAADHHTVELEMLQRMKRVGPPRIIPLIDRKIALTCHHAAYDSMRSRARRRAWGYHARSLCHAGGWRYIPYTVRLLVGLLPQAPALEHVPRPTR